MAESSEGVPKDPEADLRSEFTFSEEGQKSSRKKSTPVETVVKIVGAVLATKEGVDLVRGPVNAVGRGLRKVAGTERKSDRRRGRGQPQPGAAGGGVPPGEPPKPPPGGGGKPPEGPPPAPTGKEKNEPPKGPSFSELQRTIDDPRTSEDQKKLARAEIDKMIEDVTNFDKDFLGDARASFIQILKKSEWDDVYANLLEKGSNVDNELMGIAGANPRWKGIYRQAFSTEAAKVLAAGIDSKRKGGFVDPTWYRKHDYSPEEIVRLRLIAENKHVFDLSPDVPEEFVGMSLEAKKQVVPEDEILRKMREGRETLQPVPLYFGAVFEGGKNEIHVSRHDIIPSLDLKENADRESFIFRNVYAFDYLFRKPDAWKLAVDDWLQDVAVADLLVRLDAKELDKFEKDLKAMMAVTASARAMEESAGVAKSYLETLVGLDKKGEPNLDAQDTWDSFLLHSDPDKMKRVLGNGLVNRYYKILMADAGLECDISHNEWQEYPDPDPRKPDKTIQNPSVLVWTVEDPTSLGRNNRLTDYLKKGGKKGGFQKYIEEVLLPLAGGDEDRVIKMAAARVACDAFLVDKWTRWEDAVTGHNMDNVRKLSLQPKEDWGGDPLKGILWPTFLPRLKKVYSNEYEYVLNFLDESLRPEYLFTRISEEVEAGKYEPLGTDFRTVTPSMVTNLKTFSRISDAAYKVFGSSMATGLPSWKTKTVEEIPSIADLLTQVYGTTLNVKDGRTGRSIPIGKHIVGEMVMRLLYAKAYTATMESAKPNAGEIMAVIFNPQDREKPFLEIEKLLFGPKIDGRAGFINEIAGPRTNIIVGGNYFNAEKFYGATYDLLHTNDQSGGNYAAALNMVGKSFRILSAIGEGFGIAGKR